ncbi:MAG: MoaD/ThiS family protein [Alphaproteobacteria bacterium]|nr:MoaD/ThiS family protein [Alphaproteobacteria bacterium]
MVKLVFLGKFRGLARDNAEVALPADVGTLAELKDWIVRRDPALGHAMAATQTQVIVNQSVVRDFSRRICEADEIAFLPPMSGG